MLRKIGSIIILFAFCFAKARAAMYMPMDIDARDIEGGKTQLSKFAEDKNLLLYFCFSGSKDSIREIKSLDLLQKDFAFAGLKLALVLQDGDRELMQAIIKKQNLKYITAILIDNGSLLGCTSLHKLPAGILIDKGGKIIKIFSSPTIWQASATRRAIRLAIGLESEEFL